MDPKSIIEKVLKIIASSSPVLLINRDKEERQKTNTERE